MILPDKTLILSNTLLGWGARILDKLHTVHTVSSLWEDIRHERRISFQKYVLSLDLLYIFGLVDITEGVVRRAKS
ncbi:MAG: ABC-three component system middle component 6 [Candidatus Thorarchaeota archaeon]